MVYFCIVSYSFMWLYTYLNILIKNYIHNQRKNGHEAGLCEGHLAEVRANAGKATSGVWHDTWQGVDPRWEKELGWVRAGQGWETGYEKEDWANKSTYWG